MVNFEKVNGKVKNGNEILSRLECNGEMNDQKIN